MGGKTALHSNPFCVLGVSTRDDSRRIVEVAEERALFIDHDICQKARSDLTNPRARLSAEMAWLPGVAPRVAEKLVSALSENPLLVRSEQGLPDLARANLMAAACELVEDNEPAQSVATFLLDFAWVVDSIDADKVLRDVNEDRSISGFPEVRAIDPIRDELAERRKSYLSVLRKLLDSMEPEKIIETMTDAVSIATHDGAVHGPALLDDLVDRYDVETQGFLQKEYENITELVHRARQTAPRGAKAVSTILDGIERVARNWDLVAQPIQVSAKSRGIVHQHSREVALELRSLAIDLHNDHGLLDQAHRMTELLREIFVEVPEVAERLDEDAKAISDLRRQAEERNRNEEEWARTITFRADVGLMFKDELAIGSSGIMWKGKNYPLDSITRVRWGGVRHSVNGIPTGTDYTVGFGDNRVEQVIQLRKQSTYNGFIDALWRAVGVRLMIEMIDALSKGRSFSFGDITVSDDNVTLVTHKFFGANEKTCLSWSEVHVWSADGSFFIGRQSDKKTYGSASYINTWNTHILENLIRGGFKKGVRKLSDFLRV